MILMAGHSKDTGRYDLDSVGSLPGFSSGMILEVFHISGIWLNLSDRLKMWVRYSIPAGPMCLRWTVAILSGPIALEALAFLIASLVCSVEKVWGLAVLFRLMTFVMCLASL